VLDRVAKHNRIAAVPTAHTYRRFVRVFVVLDVGERHLLRLEGIAEISIQQLDRDVVASPHFGELVEQPVPVFSGPLMDQVLRPALRTPYHAEIFAPGVTEDKRGLYRKRGITSRAVATILLPEPGQC
jgi:hypothetical protein